MTTVVVSEEELDTLVSIAIRRAEFLEDSGLPGARQAWLEVMAYETRLAKLTRPADVTGGVARVGAVRAALAAGDRLAAQNLATQYLAEDSLPDERRTAIRRAFDEAMERLAQRFPVLAKTGRLAELQQWRSAVSDNTAVFPRAA
jgi:hypothetical protein